MRVLALVEAWGQGDPGTWVEALAALIARSHRVDDADALLAIECLTHAAAEPSLTYETRQQLYVAATERSLPAIARLFLSVSPAVVAEAQLKKQLAPERVLKPKGRPLTLGERKSLARTHRREDLLLLVRDPHPAVVAIFLDNPYVTEADVVRIAALRPAVPDSLAKIAAHPKWSVRHPVKRALVMNPATPLADAIRIATTLRAGELAELAADPQLPEALRQHAADLHAATQRRPLA
ncbi:MAG: hypothetical protein H0T42_33100 [Deltaproteobacteria bacterium]|nr:hypothetical protein [Deltaproteobacteria bacterium]